MKTWLWRAAPWTRWFGRPEPVPAERFRRPGEPYADHWRAFPDPWPDGLTDDPAVAEQLRAALATLPEPWARVVRARDVERRDPAEVAATLHLGIEEQEQILTLARAALREAIAAWLADKGPS